MASKQEQQLFAYGNDATCMTRLARIGGLGAVDKASAAFARIAPMVVDAMKRSTTSPTAAEGLMAHAFGLTWVERETPEVIFSRTNLDAERSLAAVIFAGSTAQVTSQVAETEQIDDVQASAILEVIAALALAVMAGEPNRPLTVQALASTLGVEAPASVAAAPAAAAPMAAVAPSTVPIIDPALEPTGSDSKKGLLIGGLVGLLALAGIGLVAVGGGGSDDAVDEDLVAPSSVDDGADVVDVGAGDADPNPIDDSDEPTPDAQVDADDADPDDADADPDDADRDPVNGDGDSMPDPDPAPTDEGAEPDAADDPGVVEADLAATSSADKVSFSVPMLDIVTPTRDASGVLNFSFDTLSGEVCYSVESSNIEGPYRSHIHVGGYGVQGGIVVDLGLLESGEIGCVANLPIDTADILADRSNHYAELHDVSEEWTIRGQLSETIDGDIVSLSVPMTDVEGITPEAAGALNFTFDTVTGEVCYSVDSINIDGPYRSHIHVGEAGVKGGIVVDLGPLDSGDVGCVDNLPVDTNAILASKAGHYAELHDVSEEFTIRGQLSESTVGTGVPDLPAQVDADGGGASIVLFQGTVFLQGAVPDQATADELFESLSDIDAGTPVVNELTVEEGAPLPSGRVVIADAVFFDKGSSDVKAIDTETLDAITALALSRDDWVLTVVGHTDSSGSDVSNLELSLRRATALRDLLSAQGVPDDNLRVRGAGETAPIGDNNTEAGRAQNRRIEFEFSPAS